VLRVRCVVCVRSGRVRWRPARVSWRDRPWIGDRRPGTAPGGDHDHQVFILPCCYGKIEARQAVWQLPGGCGCLAWWKGVGRAYGEAAKQYWRPQGLAGWGGSDGESAACHGRAMFHVRGRWWAGPCEGGWRVRLWLVVKNSARRRMGTRQLRRPSHACGRPARGRRHRRAAPSAGAAGLARVDRWPNKPLDRD
jgi:hypothetical protein